MRRLVVSIALAIAGIAVAQAQTYPSRPITIVVPFPPGGSTDVVGRIMADRMRLSLGIIWDVSKAFLTKETPWFEC